MTEQRNTMAVAKAAKAQTTDVQTTEAPTGAQPRRSRALPILAALLVAQLALIAWLFRPLPSQPPAGALLSNFDPAEVNAITIAWDEKELHMARSGDGWVLPDRDDFPANATAITNFLGKIAQIDTSRLVATNAASHERLRVDATSPIRRVEMITSGDKKLTFFVGTAPNARATNVRAGDSDNVYLTSALSTGDLRVDLPAWVNTQYLNLDPATINQLTIENGAGTLKLTKNGAGAWALADLAPGASMITGTVETLVRNLATLGLSDVLGTENKPEYGLEQPLATVTLDFTAAPAITNTAALTAAPAAPSAPVQIVVGARDDASGSYAVKASTSPYIARVTAATLEPFVKATRTAFIAAPPAPEETPLP